MITSIFKAGNRYFFNSELAKIENKVIFNFVVFDNLFFFDCFEKKIVLLKDANFADEDSVSNKYLIDFIDNIDTVSLPDHLYYFDDYFFFDGSDAVCYCNDNMEDPNEIEEVDIFGLCFVSFKNENLFIPDLDFHPDYNDFDSDILPYFDFCRKLKQAKASNPEIFQAAEPNTTTEGAPAADTKKEDFFNTHIFFTKPDLGIEPNTTEVIEPAAEQKAEPTETTINLSLINKQMEQLQQRLAALETENEKLKKSKKITSLSEAQKLIEKRDIVLKKINLFETNEKRLDYFLKNSKPLNDTNIFEDIPNISVSFTMGGSHISISNKAFLTDFAELLLAKINEKTQVLRSELAEIENL